MQLKYIQSDTADTHTQNTKHKRMAARRPTRRASCGAHHREAGGGGRRALRRGPEPKPRLGEGGDLSGPA